MLDAPEIRSETAYLIRPLPSGLASGSPPLRLGGKPRLPHGMDWPRSRSGMCDHFVAEIDFAPNPLHVDGADPAEHERTLKANHKEMLRAYREAAPMPPDAAHASSAADVTERPDETAHCVPTRFLDAKVGFQHSYLDWQFIFDWAHSFIEESFELAIAQLEEMQEAGASQRRVSRLIRKLTAPEEAHAQRRYLQGKPPRFRSFKTPVAVKEAFDWQARRWDSRIVQAHAALGHTPGRLMPNQLFGHGFEMQRAVTDHRQDVLLLQFGDAFGLPLEIGPDMVVQLWISADDLASGIFDRVTMTMEMA